MGTIYIIFERPAWRSDWAFVLRHYVDGEPQQTMVFKKLHDAIFEIEKIGGMGFVKVPMPAWVDDPDALYAFSNQQRAKQRRKG